jgi:predicted negative regulator of RcsB-dependent stress response
MQLAKLELHDRKYDSALRYADAAVKLTPDDHSVHFVRGQILQKLGRQQEANTEFAASRNLLGSSLERERANFQKDQVPDPNSPRNPDSRIPLCSAAAEPPVFVRQARLR